MGTSAAKHIGEVLSKYVSHGTRGTEDNAYQRSVFNSWNYVEESS
jgi:hypothetical protein